MAQAQILAVKLSACVCAKHHTAKWSQGLQEDDQEK